MSYRDEVRLAEEAQTRALDAHDRDMNAHEKNPEKFNKKMEEAQGHIAELDLIIRETIQERDAIQEEFDRHMREEHPIDKSASVPNPRSAS